MRRAEVGLGVMVDVSRRELGGSHMGENVWLGGRITAVDDGKVTVKLYGDFNGVGEVEVPEDPNLLKDASETLG